MWQRTSRHREAATLDEEYIEYFQFRWLMTSVGNETRLRCPWNSDIRRLHARRNEEAPQKETENIEGKHHWPWGMRATVWGAAAISRRWAASRDRGEAPENIFCELRVLVLCSLSNPCNSSEASKSAIDPSATCPPLQLGFFFLCALCL